MNSMMTALGLRVTPLERELGVATLTAALALLEEKGWTRGADARNRYGKATHPLSPRATCYCAQGALLCASPPGSGDKALLVVERLVAHRYDGAPLTYFNDASGQKKENVLAIFHEALELFKKEGSSS
jgi:hypothetical protein